MDKRVKYGVLIIIALLLSVVGYISYHANKPILDVNHISDDFDDRVLGTFPAGWWDLGTIANTKVVNIDGDKAMQISIEDDSYTEVKKMFKKSSNGTVSFDIYINDIKGMVGVHLPQKDSEYDPKDDAIIGLYDGKITAVSDCEEHDDMWSEIRYNDNPVYTYDSDKWYTIKIDFNLDKYTLYIDNKYVGTYNYPVENPDYITSLYFWGNSDPGQTFKFYIDNVDIKLYNTIESVHSWNYIPILISILSLLSIGLYLIKKD